MGHQTFLKSLRAAIALETVVVVDRKGGMKVLWCWRYSFNGDGGKKGKQKENTKNKNKKGETAFGN